ncbi:MAG: 4-hydroxythreonine-4-phosphate dehydrogenase PdxA [Planctomycetes bacterium]|nr:4-hydroxythreonine-4-phosphate dehydrogenase PdxA [Planctomycetota bacterium]
MARDERPWIGLTLGDPAGIGPEICLAALADRELERELRLVCIGPDRFRPASAALVAEPTRAALEAHAGHAWCATDCAAELEIGRAQRAGGAAALAALRRGVDLATNRTLDALVTAPVSKEALHLAGERVEGQTELLARWAGVERYEMIAIAGPLCVMLLSRHMPLAAALACVTRARVLDHLVLFDETLRRLGIARPKIALAGLNPHAGERGILGTEEIERLEPAVADARRRGLDVAGPLSPDTVFLRAFQGEFDGVLALYHDQAFIPVKLAAPETGLTLIAGLPYLRISPAHGTAFDIAGRGRASPRNLFVALRRAAEWARAGLRERS